MTTSVLLVDDHPVFRKGLRLLLEEEEDLCVVGEAGNGEEAITRVRELSPTVVLMDITMPGLNGIEATQRILSESPDTKIVALSIHSGKRFVEDMLRAGAKGYILKDSAPEDLVDGIQTVVGGEIYLSPAIAGVVVSQYMNALSLADAAVDHTALTPRERETAKRIAEGRSLEEMAASFGISPKTVESTRRRIMKKLGVNSVEELAEVVREGSWMTSPDHPAAGKDAAHPILRTKLHRPPIPPDYLIRKQILTRLTNLDKKPLTLISAPAGYGKSSLASGWLETCEFPHAWLSLDEDDNDLRRFLSYFLSAVQTLFPDAGKETGTLAMAPNLPPLPVLTDTLLNDLDRIDESFILVLDDYHRIRDPQVHDLLAALLTHPPKRMHLALLTRRDPPLPLGTLRALGQMNEISSGHLRFSRAETAAFLEKVLHLTVDEARLAIIDEKIEGWPAGLRLVVHSLEDQHDLERIIDSLQGGLGSILEYLVTEVLSRQPNPIAETLIKISVLDRFCAPLCDALCEPGDESSGEGIRGADFIAWLRRNHLFVIALDGENHWFRYHHLFQQLLQRELEERLSSEEIDALHGRASEWFEKNGFLDESIHHALDAKDAERAAGLVERNRQVILDNDQWYVLEKWLAQFPEGIIQQGPELLMARAWVRYHHFDIPALPSILDTVETLSGDVQGNELLRGEIDFFRGYIFYFQNDGKRSLKHLDHALKRIPETSHEIRGQAEILHGLARQMEGQEKKAISTLKNLIYQKQTVPCVRKTRQQITLVYIHIISGELEEAFAVNEELYTFAARNDYEYVRSWSIYLRGLIGFYQNDLNSAIDHFSQAVEKKYILHKRAVMDSMAGLAYAYHATGNADQSGVAMEQLSTYADTLDDPAYAMIARSCRTRLSIMMGEQSSAERWIRLSPPPAENMIWWLEIPAITHCRALLAQDSEESLGQAEIKLTELLQLNQKNHNTCHQIQIMPLLAMVYKKQERLEEALKILEEAITLAIPGRWIRPFVDAGPFLTDMLSQLKEQGDSRGYIEKHLAALEKSGLAAATKESGLQAAKSAPGAQPIEIAVPLSQREFEILSHVAKGLSNKEIAACLHISPDTVKKHLYNTYQKLEVDSRILAISRAKELGILPND